MEKTQWIGRQRDVLAMALDAAISEAGLTHYELTYGYSIRAAHGLPFMLPNKGPATEGERTLLRSRPPAPPRSDKRFDDVRGKPGITRITDPAANAEELARPRVSMSPISRAAAGMPATS